MKKLRSKKRTVKSKKRLFSFISSFYFISILARLSLLFMMAFIISFIISKIFLSTLFPPKNEVYAAVTYCCVTYSITRTIPADIHLNGYQDSACTNQIVPNYYYKDTLPFTIGSTTYYQLPANVIYYRPSAGMCQ